MSENPLEALLSNVESALTHNADVLAEADRVLSGSPYMAVVRAHRVEVATRAEAKRAARGAARSGPAGRRAAPRF